MPANRTGWGLPSRRDRLSSKASDIYGGLVAQARSVPFYARHGVPDTPEGRLELILLHVVLASRRLQVPGEGQEGLARALLETFVTDMDDCMREMGVGDMMVAKKVKKAAAALFDRVRDYGAKLDGCDRDGLAALIAAHVLMAEVGDTPNESACKIAAYALDCDARLKGLPIDALQSAATAFAPVPA